VLIACSAVVILVVLKMLISIASEMNFLEKKIEDVSNFKDFSRI
jgi:hypothetical protein